MAYDIQDNEFNLKRWWPHVSFYISENRNRALKVFVKSERSSYFEEVKNVLNVKNLQFIVDVLNIQNSSFGLNPYIPKWRGSFAEFDLRILTNLDKLY